MKIETKESLKGLFYKYENENKLLRELVELYEKRIVYELRSGTTVPQTMEMREELRKINQALGRSSVI